MPNMRKPFDLSLYANESGSLCALRSFTLPLFI